MDYYDNYDEVQHSQSIEEKGEPRSITLTEL